MSLRQKTISGIIWTFTQQFGTQIVGFSVSLVLARLLLPSDFGTIAVFSVVMGIGSVFIDSGLTNSLIRTQGIDDIDLSTVFHFNLIISIIVYLAIAVTAPWVSIFFEIPELTKIIRVYAVILPISAFSTIQQTLLTKKMDFRTQLKVQMPSLLLSGVSGILLALNGFGVWSLVYMAIIQSLLSSVQFWWYSKWRPKRVFDQKKFKFHFNFGYKLALSSLLAIIFQNIYTVVIGKIFNPTQLGYYNRANSMQQLPVTSITHPLNKVTYPLFAEIQDDNTRLKSVYSRLMRTVIFITAPLLTLMGVLAEPMFRFLFTDKWLPAVPYFQILCIAGILLPIHSYNLNILKVKGRSDLFLKLEIIKKTMTIIMIVITFRFGIIAMLWGRVILSVLFLIINSHFSGKYLNYNVLHQLSDIFPSILLSVIVGSFVFIVDHNFFAFSHDLVRLTIGVTLALTSYTILAHLFKFKEVRYVKDIISKEK